MNELTKNTLSDSIKSLDNESTNIVDELLKTNDPKKIQDLTGLFNVATTKKNAIRIMKMSELWDHATDELIRRVEEHLDMASNEELTKYVSLAEMSMERATKTLSSVDVTPVIQINQQNNTVNIESGENIPRDDRIKLLEFVNNVINKVKSAPAQEETTNE